MLAADLGSGWVPGSLLIVLRRGYRHHGICVGSGRVTHYAGLTRHRWGRIEEVSLDDFIGNRPIHIGTAPGEVRGRDFVRRARSRLGERRYDLLKNNCAHFCNWCVRGESRSQQIESLSRPIRALARLAATLRASFFRVNTVTLGYSLSSFMNIKAAGYSMPLELFERFETVSQRCWRLGMIVLRGDRCTSSSGRDQARRSRIG